MMDARYAIIDEPGDEAVTTDEADRQAAPSLGSTPPALPQQQAQQVPVKE
jgi:hypothetical protein